MSRSSTPRAARARLGTAAREFAAAALKGTLTETATAPGCKTATRTFDFTALRS